MMIVKNESEETIELKAMCVFQKDGKVLVSKGFDDIKNEHFFRVLGGGVNFGETAEAGVRREIKEELASEIENLKFITVVENLFTYRGERGHEIVFLYSGDLAKKELYEKNLIHIIEDTHEFDAEWIKIEDILNNKILLYPKFDYEKLFKL